MTLPVDARLVPRPGRGRRRGTCEALGGRYPVDREVLAADVRSLVETLAGARLVEAT